MVLSNNIGLKQRSVIANMTSCISVYSTPLISINYIGSKNHFNNLILGKIYVWSRTVLKAAVSSVMTKIMYHTYNSWIVLSGGFCPFLLLIFITFGFRTKKVDLMIVRTSFFILFWASPSIHNWVIKLFRENILVHF